MDDLTPAIPGSIMDTPGKRVRWALHASGKKATKLADHLGITRAAVSQWWQPVNPTSPAAHLGKIAEFLGCSAEWLITGTGQAFRETDASIHLQFMPANKHNDPRAVGVILTLGEVAAGMWLAVSETNDMNYEREPSAFPPLPEYSATEQYDLIVRGTSIDRFAGDGDRVRCVSIHANIAVQSGDYVHVERYRHQRSEVENTIKQAFLVKGRWELRCHSHDMRWFDQPPLIAGVGPDEQVEIVGIALYQFSPSPLRRRL
jgi:transcriptional regulator with XRE-family HTH domain